MLAELKILLLKSQMKGFFFPAKINVLKEENFCNHKNIEHHYTNTTPIKSATVILRVPSRSPWLLAEISGFTSSISSEIPVCNFGYSKLKERKRTRRGYPMTS